MAGSRCIDAYQAVTGRCDVPAAMRKACGAPAIRTVRTIRAATGRLPVQALLPGALQVGVVISVTSINDGNLMIFRCAPVWERVGGKPI